MSSANTSNEDPFLEYLFTRLLPFINKYKFFLLSVLAGFIIVLLVLGIYSSHTDNVREQTLNDVYSVLSDKKNIDIKKLASLNEQHSDNPSALEAKWILAAEYTKQEQYDKALKIYSEIIDMVPENPLVIHCLLSAGSCHESGGKYQEALQTYSRGAEKYSGHPDVKAYFLYRKARAAYYADKFAQAEDMLALSEQELPFLTSESRRSEMASSIEYLRARINLKKK